MRDQADSIYLEAREIADLAERAAFMDEVCAGSIELRQQIERMLAEEARAEAFFAEEKTGPGPLDRTELMPPPPPPASELEGRLIGRYKLLQKLGEGGFGSVWMAEQTEPVRRKVALKIIKRGMDTCQVIARFEAERQALALMNHPNIAKVLDAGTTDTGRPYFVMELVKGIPVTDFCNQWKLDTEQRLELFAEICSAINHAHQKGIIHRDIKPSNVLVTLHVDRPVPMVIDFGIAKATEFKLTDKTVFTRKDEFLGTPAYMSPEQVGLSGLDIDTRSDIYSLGVLLYELLAGQPPFEPKKLVSAGFDEMRRIIREVDPPKPSLKLSASEQEEAERIQEQLGATPQKLGRLLKGELDWIVMKALEKDRTRRYESANALADDVKRYLANELVQARPPSKFYEFQKSVRRHKFGFAATAAIIVALAIEGTLAMWWQGAAFRKSKREVETAKGHAQVQQIAAEQARAALLAMGMRNATNFAAIPPKPVDLAFLHDLAAVISADDARIISGLQQEVFRQSGVPIEVVTIRYLHDYDPASPSIESFARRWYEVWEMGAGDRGDGILVVVSTGDRKAHIELGPQWEKRFDGLRRRLITREMVPRFKGGYYGEGLIAAVTSLAAIAKAGPQSDPPVPSLRDLVLNNAFMVFIRQNNPIARFGGTLVTLLTFTVGLGCVVATIRFPKYRRRLSIAGGVLMALALVFWIGMLAIAVLIISRWRGSRGTGRLGRGLGIHRVTGKLRGMGSLNHADRLFSPGDREQISRRIAKLERRTDAEVVCAVATESGRYDRAESLCGLAVGFGALILCTKLAGMDGWDSSTTLSLRTQIILVAGGFLLGSVLASYWHGLRSLLVSSREKKSEVSRTAHQVFTQHGVGSTPNRGGVLIYLSLFEKLLEVRCDHTVAEKITRSDLVTIRDSVLEKVRRGDTTAGLIAGLECAEVILARALPASGPNSAPLSDEILLFHPRP